VNNRAQVKSVSGCRQTTGPQSACL